jgi:putative ABC transport system permease protein
MNGARRYWQVVGVSGRTLNPSAYIPLQDFDRFFKEAPIQRVLAIQTDRTDKAYVANIETQILARFKAKKWMVDSSMTLSGSLSSAQGQINNVIYILLGTATLVAAVGGLGLANTLELSVMERTREIGILRSLGARSVVIRILVLTESITICVISTLIGVLVSTPFGVILSDLIGNSLLARRLTYNFPLDGLIMWSVIVGVLGVIASLAPAQTAIQLTVRDTLAYE